MRKTVFLDVDGVVLRHGGIQKRVAHRCGLYVAKKLGLDIEVGMGVNRLMYQTYGHTLFGFQEGMKKLEKEFTEFVYSPELMEELAGLKENASVREDRDDLLFLLDRCGQKDVDVWLMSNAPRVWCDGVLDLMSWDLEKGKVLHCGHLWYCEELKPSVAVFERVAAGAGLLGNDSQCLLVDDSPQNIAGAVAAKWRGSLFGVGDSLGGLLV